MLKKTFLLTALLVAATFSTSCAGKRCCEPKDGMSKKCGSSMAGGEVSKSGSCADKKEMTDCMHNNNMRKKSGHCDEKSDGDKAIRMDMLDSLGLSRETKDSDEAAGHHCSGHTLEESGSNDDNDMNMDDVKMD